VCRFHGGAAPQVQAAAQARLAEAEARQLVDLQGVQPITDPYQSLAALAGEVQLFKDALRSKLAELEHLVVTDKLGREELKAVARAYERSLTRCARILAQIGKLTLHERSVRVEEAQAEQLGMVLAAVLADLGVAPTIWQPVAARHLRALHAGS